MRSLGDKIQNTDVYFGVLVCKILMSILGISDGHILSYFAGIWGEILASILGTGCEKYCLVLWVLDVQNTD